MGNREWGMGEVWAVEGGFLVSRKSRCLLSLLRICDGDFFFFPMMVSTFGSPLESKVKLNVVVLSAKEKALPDSDRQKSMHRWARMTSGASDIFDFSEITQIVGVSEDHHCSSDQGLHYTQIKTWFTC